MNYRSATVHRVPVSEWSKATCATARWATSFRRSTSMPKAASQTEKSSFFEETRLKFDRHKLDPIAAWVQKIRAAQSYLRVIGPSQFHDAMVYGFMEMYLSFCVTVLWMLSRTESHMRQFEAQSVRWRIGSQNHSR